MSNQGNAGNVGNGRKSFPLSQAESKKRQDDAFSAELRQVKNNQAHIFSTLQLQEGHIQELMEESRQRKLQAVELMKFVKAVQKYRAKADQMRIVQLLQGRSLAIYNDDGAHVHARGFVTKLYTKGNKLVLHFEDGAIRVLLAEENAKNQIEQWYRNQIAVV